MYGITTGTTDCFRWLALCANAASVANAARALSWELSCRSTGRCAKSQITRSRVWSLRPGPPARAGQQAALGQPTRVDFLLPAGQHLPVWAAGHWQRATVIVGVVQEMRGVKEVGHERIPHSHYRGIRQLQSRAKRPGPHLRTHNQAQQQAAGPIQSHAWLQAEEGCSKQQ